METKHTPGPWNIFHNGEGGEKLWITTVGNLPIAELAGENVADIPSAQKTRVANALLIAAAPDLYKAVALLVPIYRAWLEDAKKSGEPFGWQSLDDDIAFAEAAIRKAKGDQP